MKIKINSGVILRICAILLVLFLGWYFSDLALYIFLAFIFSLMGKPIAKNINRIQIFKRRIPYGICALLTMIIFILFFVLIFIFLVPLLLRETQSFAEIPYDDLSQNITFQYEKLKMFLKSKNIILPDDRTMIGLVTEKIKEFANFANFSNILGKVMSATGSFFLGIFAVFFLTFFFIKDDVSLDRLAQLLFDEKHAERLTAVSEKINKLLSRYYIGLFIEIVSMIILLYIGMVILGVKKGVFLAFLGGMLNAIPYLGPLIGALCACLLGAVHCLATGDYDTILSTVLKIAGTFITANLIDNILLQPLIYSQSVKVHPVEIFLIIIMAGSFAGILGMLFAIPIYTMIRTIVIEIFNYVYTK